MPKSPILGQAYTARSKNLSDSRCVNLFMEIAENKAGKEVGALYSTPGLQLIATVGVGPIRGMLVSQNTLYIVSGFNVFSIDLNMTVKFVGQIGTGTGAVSMINNGLQVGIFDGATGYCVQGSTLLTLTLPFVNPTGLAYQDGTGIAFARGSQQWFASNLFDLTTWDGANFATAAGEADNIVALVSMHREVWLIKERTTEVWINAGNNGFTFSRLDGIFMQKGCVAPATAITVGETVMWLASNTEGQGMCVQAKSVNGADRVSTHAMEYEWSQYPTIADATAYSYYQEGHLFYVLNFPSGNATWVFDATASAQLGIPMWHRRAAFLNGAFNRHWGNCACFFPGLNLNGSNPNGQVVVGDCLSGNLYSYNLNQLTDNGVQRKWLRSFRALQADSLAPQRFSALQIDMQTGVSVPQGTAPQVMMRFSDDGGRTWSSERYAAAGPAGATSQRVKFNRLGSTRLSSGLDRIFEISSSDAFGMAILGAEVTE